MKADRHGVRVQITRNEPYLVAGPVRLADLTIATDAAGVSEEWGAQDRPEPGKSVALCRCGHSESKPFCDGTHAAIKFHAK